MARIRGRMNRWGPMTVCHGRLVRAEVCVGSEAWRARLAEANCRPMEAALPGKMPGAHRRISFFYPCHPWSKTLPLSVISVFSVANSSRPEVIVLAWRKFCLLARNFFCRHLGATWAISYGAENQIGCVWFSGKEIRPS